MVQLSVQYACAYCTTPMPVPPCYATEQAHGVRIRRQLTRHANTGLMLLGTDGGLGHLLTSPALGRARPADAGRWTDCWHLFGRVPLLFWITRWCCAAVPNALRCRIFRVPLPHSRTLPVPGPDTHVCKEYWALLKSEANGGTPLVDGASEARPANPFSRLDFWRARALNATG